jgi:hypothetical protein
MDGAEVSMACMCSNRSCPCCWCPDFQLDDTRSSCKIQGAKDVFAQLDVAREQMLDEEDCVLRGKAVAASETEKRLKHKLLPRNAWRLIEYFELFMSCPKDELHQWFVIGYDIHMLFLKKIYQSYP